VVETNNVLTTQKPGVKDHLERKCMRLEPSAPYTGAQLGDTERSGSVVKDRIRTMAIGAICLRICGQARKKAFTKDNILQPGEEL
jgi:hypothetical protein